MAEDDEKQFKAKVAVLGESGVGKSCLISVFSAIMNKRCSDTFQEIVDNTTNTVGCDFMSTKFTLPDNRVVKLNIWDTAGQEKYRSINRNLYLGANGALLCFDLTVRFSRDDIEVWKKEVQEHAGTRCSIVVIGTKSDGNVIEATRELLDSYAKENHFPFVETSAIQGSNVREAFKVMVHEIDSKVFKNTKVEKAVDDKRFNIADASDAISTKNSSNCC